MISTIKTPTGRVVINSVRDLITVTVSGEAVLNLDCARALCCEVNRAIESVVKWKANADERGFIVKAL